MCLNENPSLPSSEESFKYGHATPEEKEYIERLESAVDVVEGSVEKLLELAVLYLDPCHRGSDAVVLLNVVLEREPTHAIAKLWLGYCYTYELPDIEQAQPILQELLTENAQDSTTAAAHMLSAVILDRFDAVTVRDKIKLLEASVILEPGWVNNRSSLSWAYKEADRLGEAVIQMQQALANIIDRDPKWSMAEEAFEINITGRYLAPRDFLQAELDEMQLKELQGKTR